MRRTGIVIDPRFQEHDPGAGHPERPQRIAALLDSLQGLTSELTQVAARQASGDEIALVHGAEYIDSVGASAARARSAFDPDTQACARSYDTARLAVGGFLSLLDQVVEQRIDNGFAFVRPPGHHAERRRAMGFCLFNNVAVGAAYLRQRYGLQRILVLDWDVHHGNGTQHMFEDDPGVLYISTHQYPFYPGTGAADEAGEGGGAGYTVNLPLPAGCGDAEYHEMFERIIEPIAHLYAPQFVLISAGFDGHARDPLGGMQLSSGAYAWMTRAMLRVAADHAGGRCAAILEGGYDLDATCASAAAVLHELRGDEPAARTPAQPSRAAALAEHLTRFQRRYWKV